MLILFLKRLTVCALILSFLLPDTSTAKGYAQNTSATALSRELVSPQTAPPLNLSTVKLPEEMGIIDEMYAGPGKQSVVLIRDAHSVPDAQRNIQHIIAYFQEHHGVTLIGLEGASGPLDVQIFKSFPDQMRLRKIFDKYLEKGELAGGPAAALFSSMPGSWFGVEDQALYESALAAYLSAQKQQSSLMQHLENRKKSLERQKDRNFPPRLREIDRALEEFQDGHGEFIEILKRLSEIKPPDPHSQLALILKAESTREESENLNTAILQIAKKIQTHLGQQSDSAASKTTLKEFNRHLQDFQSSLISPGKFILELKETADSLKMALVLPESLNLKALQQKDLEQIRGSRLFDDFERYAGAVKASMIENQQQRNLERQSRGLRLLERLIRMELSWKEWAQVKDKSLPPQLSTHASFYRIAEQRDQAFLHHLNKRISESNERSTSSASAIFVVGGFHARRMADLFRQQGISYALVIPRINQIPDKSVYQAQMSGRVSWQKYFRVQDGRINLYEAFVRAARDRLLGIKNEELRTRNEGDADASLNAAMRQHHSSFFILNSALLKSWRDQILRDMAARGAIANSRRYTRFLDEISQPVPKQKLRDDLIAKSEKFIAHLKSIYLQLHGPVPAKSSHLISLSVPATSVMPFVDNSIPIFGSLAQRGARLEIRTEMPPDLIAAIQTVKKPLNEYRKYVSYTLLGDIRDQRIDMKTIALKKTKWRRNPFQLRVTFYKASYEDLTDEGKMKTEYGLLILDRAKAPSNGIIGDATLKRIKNNRFELDRINIRPQFQHRSIMQRALTLLVLRLNLKVSYSPWLFPPSETTFKRMAGWDRDFHRDPRISISIVEPGHQYFVRKKEMNRTGRTRHEMRTEQNARDQSPADSAATDHSSPSNQKGLDPLLNIPARIENMLPPLTRLAWLIYQALVPFLQNWLPWWFPKGGGPSGILNRVVGRVLIQMPSSKTALEWYATGRLDAAVAKTVGQGTWKKRRGMEVVIQHILMREAPGWLGEHVDWRRCSGAADHATNRVRSFFENHPDWNDYRNAVRDEDPEFFEHYLRAGLEQGSFQAIARLQRRYLDAAIVHELDPLMGPYGEWLENQAAKIGQMLAGLSAFQYRKVSEAVLEGKPAPNLRELETLEKRDALVTRMRQIRMQMRVLTKLAGEGLVAGKTQFLRYEELAEDLRDVGKQLRALDSTTLIPQAQRTSRRVETRSGNFLETSGARKLVAKLLEHQVANYINNMQLIDILKPGKPDNSGILAIMVTMTRAMDLFLNDFNPEVPGAFFMTTQTEGLPFIATPNTELHGAKYPELLRTRSSQILTTDERRSSALQADFVAIQVALREPFVSLRDDIMPFEGKPLLIDRAAIAQLTQKAAAFRGAYEKLMRQLVPDESVGEPEQPPQMEPSNRAAPSAQSTDGEPRNEMRELNDGGGGIGKFDAVKIEKVEDLGDRRVRLSGRILRDDRKRGQPIELFGRRTSKNLLTGVSTLHSNVASVDTAMDEILGSLPDGNVILLDENHESIRGFGCQYQERPLIGLVDALATVPLAQWNVLMHVANSTERLTPRIVSDGAERGSHYAYARSLRKKYDSWTTNFWRSFKQEIETFQISFWYDHHRELSQQLRQPVPIPGDEGSVDQKLLRRLSRVGSAARIWHFLARHFGHGRKDIQLAITRTCPMGCPFCLTHDKMSVPGPNRDMPLEDAKRIIDQLAGTDRIVLTGGEPFLYGQSGAQFWAGNISETFRELVQYASERVEEVVLDTSGLSIPEDESAAEEFFKQFPPNVVFELSLDDGHDERLAHFGHSLKNIVKNCEQEEIRTKRPARYNVRVNDGPKEGGQQIRGLQKWDYENRLTSALNRQEDSTRQREDVKKLRVSRIKLQSAAVDAFDPFAVRQDTPYAPMEPDRFIQNVVPKDTFLFVSHDLKVYFDAHAGFMEHPSEISNLGNLRNKNLSEVMIDGMLGRFMGFERFPFLRKLVFACWLNEAGDQTLAEQLLRDVTVQGTEYETMLRNEFLGRGAKSLFGGFGILAQSDNPSSFQLFFYIASLYHLLTAGNVPWLTNVLPSHERVIWDAFIDFELRNKQIFYNSEDVRRAEVQKMRIAAVRDFVQASPEVLPSLDSTADFVIDLINHGLFATRALKLLTERDGTFRFLPSAAELEYWLQPDIPRTRGWGYSEESTLSSFKEYAEAMEIFLGSHAADFFRRLTDKLRTLQASFAGKTDEMSLRKQRLIEVYLTICRQKIEQPAAQVEHPTVRDLLIDYFNAIVIWQGSHYEASYVSVPDFRDRIRWMSQAPTSTKNDQAGGQPSERLEMRTKPSTSDRAETREEEESAEKFKQRKPPRTTSELWEDLTYALRVVEQALSNRETSRVLVGTERLEHLIPYSEKPDLLWQALSELDIEGMAANGVALDAEARYDFTQAIRRATLAAKYAQGEGTTAPVDTANKLDQVVSIRPRQLTEPDDGEEAGDHIMVVHDDNISAAYIVLQEIVRRGQSYYAYLQVGNVGRGINRYRLKQDVLLGQPVLEADPSQITHYTEMSPGQEVVLGQTLTDPGRIRIRVESVAPESVTLRIQGPAELSLVEQITNQATEDVSRSQPKALKNGGGRNEMRRSVKNDNRGTAADFPALEKIIRSHVTDNEKKLAYVTSDGIRVHQGFGHADTAGELLSLVSRVLSDVRAKVNGPYYWEKQKDSLLIMPAVKSKSHKAKSLKQIKGKQLRHLGQYQWWHEFPKWYRNARRQYVKGRKLGRSSMRYGYVLEITEKMAEFKSAFQERYRANYGNLEMTWGDFGFLAGKANPGALENLLSDAGIRPREIQLQPGDLIRSLGPEKTRDDVLTELESIGWNLDKYQIQNYGRVIFSHETMIRGLGIIPEFCKRVRFLYRGYGGVWHSMAQSLGLGDGGLMDLIDAFSIAFEGIKNAKGEFPEGHLLAMLGNMSRDDAYNLAVSEGWKLKKILQKLVQDHPYFPTIDYYTLIRGLGLTKHFKDQVRFVYGGYKKRIVSLGKRFGLHHDKINDLVSKFQIQLDAVKVPKEHLRVVLNLTHDQVKQIFVDAEWSLTAVIDALHARDAAFPENIPYFELLEGLGMEDDYRSQILSLYYSLGGRKTLAAKQLKMYEKAFNVLCEQLNIVWEETTVGSAAEAKGNQRGHSMPESALLTHFRLDPAAVLDQARKLKWNPDALQGAVTAMIPQEFRMVFPSLTDADLFRGLGIATAFADEFRTVWDETYGSWDRTAARFSFTSENAFRILGRTFVGPLQDIPRTEGSLARALNRSADDIAKEFGRKPFSWNFDEYQKHLYGELHYTQGDFVKGLGLSAQVTAKIRDIYTQSGGSYEYTARALNITSHQLDALVLGLGIRFDDIEYEDGYMLPLAGMNPNQVERLAKSEKIGWGLPKLRDAVQAIHQRKRGFALHLNYRDVIIGLNLRDAFKKRFEELKERHHGDLAKIAKEFKLPLRLLVNLLKETIPAEAQLKNHREAVAFMNHVGWSVVDFVRRVESYKRFGGLVLKKWEGIPMLQHYQIDETVKKRILTAFRHSGGSVLAAAVSIGFESEGGLFRKLIRHYRINFKKVQIWRGDLLKGLSRPRQAVLDKWTQPIDQGGFNWKLPEFRTWVIAAAKAAQHLGYPRMIQLLGFEREFRLKVMEVFTANFGDHKKTAAFFGVEPITLQNLAYELDIHLITTDVPLDPPRFRAMLGYSSEDALLQDLDDMNWNLTRFWEKHKASMPMKSPEFIWLIGALGIQTAFKSKVLELYEKSANTQNFVLETLGGINSPTFERLCTAFSISLPRGLVRPGCLLWAFCETEDPGEADLKMAQAEILTAAIRNNDGVINLHRLKGYAAQHFPAAGNKNFSHPRLLIGLGLVDDFLMACERVLDEVKDRHRTKAMAMRYAAGRFGLNSAHAATILQTIVNDLRQTKRPASRRQTAVSFARHEMRSREEIGAASSELFSISSTGNGLAVRYNDGNYTLSRPEDFLPLIGAIPGIQFLDKPLGRDAEPGSYWVGNDDVRLMVNPMEGDQLREFLEVFAGRGLQSREHFDMETRYGFRFETTPLSRGGIGVDFRHPGGGFFTRPKKNFMSDIVSSVQGQRPDFFVGQSSGTMAHVWIGTSRKMRRIRQRYPDEMDRGLRFVLSDTLAPNSNDLTRNNFSDQSLTAFRRFIESDLSFWRNSASVDDRHWLPTEEENALADQFRHDLDVIRHEIALSSVLSLDFEQIKKLVRRFVEIGQKQNGEYLGRSVVGLITYAARNQPGLQQNLFDWFLQEPDSPLKVFLFDVILVLLNTGFCSLSTAENFEKLREAHPEPGEGNGENEKIEHLVFAMLKSNESLSPTDDDIRTFLDLLAEENGDGEVFSVGEWFHEHPDLVQQHIDEQQILAPEASDGKVELVRWDPDQWSKVPEKLRAIVLDSKNAAKLFYVMSFLRKTQGSVDAYKDEVLAPLEQVLRQKNYFRFTADDPELGVAAEHNSFKRFLIGNFSVPGALNTMYRFKIVSDPAERPNNYLVGINAYDVPERLLQIKPDAPIERPVALLKLPDGVYPFFYRGRQVSFTTSEDKQFYIAIYEAGIDGKRLDKMTAEELAPVNKHELARAVLATAALAHHGGYRGSHDGTTDIHLDNIIIKINPDGTFEIKDCDFDGYRRLSTRKIQARQVRKDLGYLIKGAVSVKGLERMLGIPETELIKIYWEERAKLKRDYPVPSARKRTIRRAAASHRNEAREEDDDSRFAAGLADAAEKIRSLLPPGHDATHYSGTVHYPAGLADLKSVALLRAVYPQARILVSDPFMPLKDNGSEKYPAGIADLGDLRYLVNFLTAAFSAHKDIVRTVHIDARDTNPGTPILKPGWYGQGIYRENGKMVMRRFDSLWVDIELMPAVAELLGCERLQFEYRAGFYQDVRDKVGVVYLHLPGYGGSFLKEMNFWEDLKRKFIAPGIAITSHYSPNFQPAEQAGFAVSGGFDEPISGFPPFAVLQWQKAPQPEILQSDESQPVHMSELITIRFLYDELILHLKHLIDSWQYILSRHSEAGFMGETEMKRLFGLLQTDFEFSGYWLEKAEKKPASLHEVQSWVDFMLQTIRMMDKLLQLRVRHTDKTLSPLQSPLEVSADLCRMILVAPQVQKLIQSAEDATFGIRWGERRESNRIRRIWERASRTPVRHAIGSAITAVLNPHMKSGRAKLYELNAATGLGPALLNPDWITEGRYTAVDPDRGYLAQFESGLLRPKILLSGVNQLSERLRDADILMALDPDFADPGKALAECYKALKPGGHLMLFYSLRPELGAIFQGGYRPIDPSFAVPSDVFYSPELNSLFPNRDALNDAVWLYTIARSKGIPYDPSNDSWEAYLNYRSAAEWDAANSLHFPAMIAGLREAGFQMEDDYLPEQLVSVDVRRRNEEHERFLQRFLSNQKPVWTAITLQRGHLEPGVLPLGGIVERQIEKPDPIVEMASVHVLHAVKPWALPKHLVSPQRRSELRRDAAIALAETLLHRRAAANAKSLARFASRLLHRRSEAAFDREAAAFLDDVRQNTDDLVLKAELEYEPATDMANQDVQLQSHEQASLAMMKKIIRWIQDQSFQKGADLGIYPGNSDERESAWYPHEYAAAHLGSLLGSLSVLGLDGPGFNELRQLLANAGLDRKKIHRQSSTTGSDFMPLLFNEQSDQFLPKTRVPVWRLGVTTQGYSLAAEYKIYDQTVAMLFLYALGIIAVNRLSPDEAASVSRLQAQLLRGEELHKDEAKRLHALIDPLIQQLGEAFGWNGQQMDPLTGNLSLRAIHDLIEQTRLDLTIQQAA
jgi:organic radical activating enzyme/SAM-dependent methyltransferase